MGFPFFVPLFSPDSEITVYAPARSEETEKYLGGLILGRYFPLELFETKARKIYREFPPEGLTIDGMTIRHCPLRHPQGAVSYRFDEDGKSVVFATDTEHPQEGVDERLAAFAKGSDVLVYDATFTPEEYEAGKRGWGHSTWLEGARLAGAAAVESLLLSHWNPDHSDSRVDASIAAAREIFPRTDAARQRLRINVR